MVEYVFESLSACKVVKLIFFSHLTVAELLGLAGVGSFLQALVHRGFFFKRFRGHVQDETMMMIMIIMMMMITMTI